MTGFEPNRGSLVLVDSAQPLNCATITALNK